MKAIGQIEARLAADQTAGAEALTERAATARRRLAKAKPFWS